jgi:VIT1/CCC1 family predicted Fe2+/Mn2+ transporter
MTTKTELYLRNVIFGIADSLVSTVGLLAGIDVAGTPRAAILLTGIVYAFVEAFSMAVGSFLSEQSAEEYEAKGETSETGPYTAGFVMFLSFVLASFIPIAPYMMFGVAAALWCSIGFSLIALLIVGMVSAKIVKVDIVKHGIKMMLLGGAAIVIGILVGKFVKAG